MIGFPSSRGPNFMYFKVRNVSIKFEMMRTIVKIVNVFSLFIYASFITTLKSESSSDSSSSGERGGGLLSGTGK